jgi:hypothetical protein
MAVNFNPNSTKPYAFDVGVPSGPKADKRPSGGSANPTPAKSNSSLDTLNAIGNIASVADPNVGKYVKAATQAFDTFGGTKKGPPDTLSAIGSIVSKVDPNAGKFVDVAKQGVNTFNALGNKKLNDGQKFDQVAKFTKTFDPGVGNAIDIGQQTLKFANAAKTGSPETGGAALNLLGTVDPEGIGKTVTLANQGSEVFKGIQSGRTDVSSAMSFTGNAIGGEFGEKLALGGNIVSDVSKIATNTVPSGAAGNFIGAGLGALQLAGLKIDPGVSNIASLAGNLLAGPLGLVGIVGQLISSLFSMGDHFKTVDMQKDINATGRIMGDDDGDGEEDQPTDKSSVLVHDKTGFMGIGSWRGTYMQYDTTGGTIDPRLLKDVEFKVDGGSSGFLGMGSKPAQLTIKANYDGINPATGGASGETKIDLSPEQVQAYKTALGGESGKIDPKDLQKMAVVAPQLNDMKLSFKQNENDPTLYNYKDVNGDGIPDRIGISLNKDGLEKKGDGSVSVTILDKDRHQVGDTLTANSSSKIEDNLKEASEMQQLRPLLETYSASHIETWDGGKDLTSTYRALKANGGLEKLKQVGPAVAEYAQARQTPGADVQGASQKLSGLVKDLGLGFDARAYAAANPDLIKNIGNDPSLLAEHYRNHGNFEGRALNLNGDKAPQWINPALRNTTVLGSEITSEPNKNAEIQKGQALVSANGKFMATMQADGNFVVYDISGKDKKVMWEAKTNEQRHNGLFGGHTTPAADRMAIQSDGNLAAHSPGQTQWTSNTANTSVNRSFKLAMQDDGNLVVKDSQGGANLWSSRPIDTGLASVASGLLAGGRGILKQTAANTDGTAPAFQAVTQAPVSYGAEQTRAA